MFREIERERDSLASLAVRRRQAAAPPHLHLCLLPENSWLPYSALSAYSVK